MLDLSSLELEICELGFKLWLQHLCHAMNFGSTPFAVFYKRVPVYRSSHQS